MLFVRPGPAAGITALPRLLSLHLGRDGERDKWERKGKDKE